MDIRDAFFEELCNIARKDRNVIILTGDMGAYKLEEFRKEKTGQVINVGIAEQNLINVATGLALGGKKVFCYGIAAFIIQRCYEQIKVNLCDMNLPVTLIGYGAGNYYERDGATHCILFDIDIMRVLPNMRIVTLDDPDSGKKVAQLGYESKTPLYIRIGNISVGQFIRR